ncbi:hypothetical protein FA15DRAFT_705614 [Coprinopsis marcescibilis]|uniref:Uncharacterized protein n=1 Tax=Coprinopsis marcescibilis TaxID=230819 RepID=A0A5C3KS26_COPMA|nr:hypothetical protein FA15DRAFT_705614 [Coprinopsis marcescibilis]
MPSKASSERFESPSENSRKARSPNDSPSSTFTASSSVRLDPARSYRNIFATPTGARTRQFDIRADASLMTCFDPADKELYDLWAPKR